MQDKPECAETVKECAVKVAKGAAAAGYQIVLLLFLITMAFEYLDEETTC